MSINTDFVRLFWVLLKELCLILDDFQRFSHVPNFWWSINF
jgi:hypothetical protein